MHLRLLIPLVAVFASAGCNMRSDSGDLRPLSQERKAAVETSVRSFVLSVAHDVTNEGPTA